MKLHELQPAEGSRKEVKVQEMVKLLDAEAKDKKLVQAVALD